MKAHHPCEIAVWYILPCIRSCLAKELVDKGLTQENVAKKLGITQSAVSQYVGEKRGRIGQKRDDIQNEVTELAGFLADDEVDDLSERMCKICTKIRSDGKLLRLCGIPEEILDQLDVYSTECV